MHDYDFSRMVFNFRYSRKIILWLKVGTTNSKPSVIARYFIDSVLQVKGIITYDCMTVSVSCKPV